MIGLILKGMGMGAANVMPGISGATLAVILQVYDRLIAAINGLTTDWRASLKFLIPFGVGIVAGIIVAGSLLSFVFERFSFQAAGFIAGLMAGSLPFLYAQARHGGSGADQPAKAEAQNPAQRVDSATANADGRTRVAPASYYMAAIVAAGLIIAAALFIETPDMAFEGTLGWGAMALLFVGGMAAAAAMIVPGVSGAMVLVLLGTYPIAMAAINQIRVYLSDPTAFELLPPILRIVLPVGLGIIPGVFLAGRAIAWLLEKHFSLTYFIIIGLVVGTVFALFHSPDTYQSGAVTLAIGAVAVVLFVCGAAVAMFLGRPAAQQESN